MTKRINLCSPPTHAVDESNSAENILATIKSLLALGKYSAAYAEFAEHIDFLLNSCPCDELQQLLIQAPIAITQNDANYLYSRGLVLGRDNKLDMAIDYLKEAQRTYLQHGYSTNAVRCTIEIARNYYRQEDFRLAHCYLAEEAQQLITSTDEIAPDLHAMFLLDMAHLATDIGKLNDSQTYAEKALQLYASLGDLCGQFRTQLRIGRNYIQVGNYTAANEHLQLARQYHHIGKFGIKSEALLLNTEIHLRWYQRQLDEALHLAILYRKIADHHQLHNARVYARILLGNLYREKEEPQLAQEWYNATETLLQEFGYALYQPWLDAQRAWLLIRTGELRKAQLFCSNSLKTKDWGQRMSYQVQQAVLHLLDDKATKAEPLLLESLDYYQKSGDSLACCMIRLYLAYAAIQNNKTNQILPNLEPALSWLDAQQLDTLPHWWHPQIVAKLCRQAIVVDLYPDVIRQICVNRLGNVAVPHLTELLRSDDMDVRRRAHHMISVVTGQSAMILSHLPNGRSKQVLQELLEKGYILADGYPRLEYELMTAKQRRHPNPTIICVFVLYLRGVKRDDIAERLDCSVENVRNYVTKIYKYFALPAEKAKGRAARREQLAQLARERGFIP